MMERQAQEDAGYGAHAINSPQQRAERSLLEVTCRAPGLASMQCALAWRLQRSPVALLILGASTVAQQEENITDIALVLSRADCGVLEIVSD
jgi:aryl-alcohol dehydrogenase-like predicted oxidoreductase